jgi:uncharacterized protein
MRLAHGRTYFALDANRMRFNVAQLLKAAPGTSREYELDEDISAIDKDIDVSAPLVGRVKFLRLGEGILVTGRVRTRVRVPCRRCLADVEVPVELQLEEQFNPSIDIVSGRPIPLEDGQEEATRTDERHMLDLTEVVRQNLVLALPMSALCKEECRGLCPACGQNLNDGNCTCQPAGGDSRLSVLRDLL